MVFEQAGTPQESEKSEESQSSILTGKKSAKNAPYL